MREPVASADGLRHRVAEREHRAAERGAAVARAPQELGARVAVVRALDDARQRLRDQTRARERMLVGVVVVSVHVERLGAVRERVHRRADRRPARQVERQLDVVDDRRRAARRRRRRASSARGRARRSTSSTPRLRTSSGSRRAGAPRPPRPPCRGRSRCRRRARRRSRRPARAPTPRRCGATGPRVQRACGSTGSSSSSQRGPATRSGALDAELVEHVRQLVEAPADDHASRDLANSTNACATRVSARPADRTSEIVARGLEPFDACRRRRCRRRCRPRSRSGR